MPAALGPPAILTGADAYLAALGYLVSLVFLVVFGIWGFRIGSCTRDEGGGGSSGPDPGSPPPTGGQEVTDHFAAWEEQWKAPEDESAAARRG